MIDRLMFKVTFDNGMWFNVCEQCCPAPEGSTQYKVEVVDLEKERERWEETKQ